MSAAERTTDHAATGAACSVDDKFHAVGVQLGDHLLPPPRYLILGQVELNVGPWFLDQLMEEEFTVV